jgi:hypothetical protein
MMRPSLRLGLGAPFLAALAASLAQPVSAQQPSTASQPDLVPVMLWTFVAALIAMGVLTLGYLYRRTRGDQDEVIPIYVEPEPGTETHEPVHEPSATASAGH